MPVTGGYEAHFGLRSFCPALLYLKLLTVRATLWLDGTSTFTLWSQTSHFVPDSLAVSCFVLHSSVWSQCAMHSLIMFLSFSLWPKSLRAKANLGLGVLLGRVVEPQRRTFAIWRKLLCSLEANFYFRGKATHEPQGPTFTQTLGDKV